MDLIDHPDNPLPPGGKAVAIDTSDRRRLRAARFLPEAGGQIRGTVVVLQGRTEFIEKYAETIADLLARRFAVVLFDWRGQGGSERLLNDPQRGFVEDFREYDRDFEAVVKQLVLPDCPPPYFALAHSTGGNVFLRMEPVMRHRFSRAVLTAPLLGLGDYGAPQGVIEAVAGVFEVLGLGDRYVLGGGPHTISRMAFEGNPLTSDAGRFARFHAIANAAEHLSIGAATWTWVKAACRSMAFVTDPVRATGCRTPMLIIESDADRIVSRAAIEAVLPHLRLARRLIIPGARHEILMERDSLRAQFWAAFDAFVPGEPNNSAPEFF
ncbi:MAG: alpha/beta hydrolase [Hyphomicrobiaceae bacterium]|nr:alpha/beta hydrolase [Hyphomicrobiaceae bacterium]